ncbi:M23 family metallopeptidase [Saccharomonospora saliphila]|uniref:M23 family metallopeptidase n=1 Tax=Saccharomonospora saliphila TaxID=369829 RepID=UPI00036E390D|nr:M23 family metallopeptidase [Saccharomonospora saliphila]
MRARHDLRRAAPIALLASLTLVSTPGVAVAAADAQPAQPRNAQVQQAAAAAQPSLDDQIASAEKALKAAQDKEASARAKLDTATREHEEAANRAASAREKAERAGAALDKARAQLDHARTKVEQLSGSQFRFGSLVGPIVGFLASNDSADGATSALLDVTGNSGLDLIEKPRAEVAQKRTADQQAQADLKQARNAERKAENALKDARKAHEATVAARDEAQVALDDLHATKQEQQAAAPPAGGAAAPQAAPGFARPAEGKFTSGYGARWGTSHLGIDIANDIGTPIRAAHPGTVISSGPASGFGLWVRVQRDDGLITLYGHINESLVSVGQEVEAGQQIATMGNRGQSTGPHLHFGVVENGSKIDPLPWLADRGITY